jgi:hypothetical protein
MVGLLTEEEKKYVTKT